ncbi:hypothetical protein [Moritella sp. F3]|uniref:hypothetical protein n=1 Tax=Moritella sp. F3 TaxID=2718882 RepID=UPI0018E1B5DA|nr:hypothetical protein [Moritella sp. F3]GIC75501.1 hypothetical protein FMO001_02280 [Moritella sp. F1]GIC80646.1 hypothetical protein FMO003_09270 [Moritella sp. F3]
MNTQIKNTNSQVLTEVELNAIRDIFNLNTTPYAVNDLVLADVEPEMLKALLQADSITIIAKHGKTENRFPLHLANDGYQNSLQGPV